MNKFFWKVVAIASLIPFAFSGTAISANANSNPETGDWARACEQNTLEAYADFLLRHPESGLSNQAYGRLSGLDEVEVAKLDGVDETSGQTQEAAPEFVPDSIMIV